MTMTTTHDTNGKAKPAMTSIALSLIDPSPTQPRKTFTGIEEMAADIKVHGILQAVLVRPHPKKADRYELVFGERRTRGAKLAGLGEVPAVVRHLSDAEVLEIQIVENAKRADIHPLEEAEAYEALHKKHGYSVEEIAAKVAKSTATIYARLKFATLVPEARKAFAEGKLTTATALLVAKIPHADLQRDALKALVEGTYDDEPTTAADAKRIIEDEFMMRLEQAPFDTKDAALLEKVPACTTCPKRTGNQRDLFAEASSKDLCIDPKCFKAKVDADWTRKAEDAKKRSLPVLEGKKAQAALSYGSGYVDLDAKNYEDRKGRTYREILGKKEVPTTLARSDAGAAKELVYAKDLAKLGVVSTKASKQDDAYAKQQKRQAAEAKKQREKQRTVVAQLVAKAGKVRSAAFELRFARAIARGCIEQIWHDTAKSVCARRELEIAKGSDPRATLKKLVDKLAVDELRGLVVELLSGPDTMRKEFATLLGVKA